MFQLFEGLLQQLLVHKPAKPIDFLIKTLKTPQNPHVVILGPPGAEARLQCELLAAKAGLVHVTASEVWRDPCNASTEEGADARARIESGELDAASLPADLMIPLLKQKLRSDACVSQGWVLEGFPSTPAEAQKMLGAGLLPTSLIHLDMPDAVATARLTGRRVDTVGSRVYHVDENPPPDAEVAARLVQRPEDTPARVAERIAAYRKNMAAVLPLFKRCSTEVDASTATAENLAETILPIATAPTPSRAPRGCPRVALLGGPGSKAEAVAASAAARYGAVLISARAIIKSAAAGQNTLAKQLAPFVQAGDYVSPLDLVAGQILARLGAEDVRKRGFVLVGYPATKAQAAWLDEKQVRLRHVVHLEMSADAARSALVGARFDPVDGSEYHVDGPMPTDADARARLAPHPLQSDAAVGAALADWQQRAPELLAHYPNVTTEDATRPVLALEERIAPCF